MNQTHHRILLSFLAFLLTVAVSAPASAIERQQAMSWCWASSIQEVMAQKGVYLTQPQIVARLTGWPQDRPASSQEVTWLLRQEPRLRHEARTRRRLCRST